MVIALPVYVRMIKAHIRDGDEAAKEASMPYYIEAGEKLLQVKESGKVRSELVPWMTKTFQRSATQLNVWMKVAKSQRIAKKQGDRFFPPRTLEGFTRPDRLRTTVDIKKEIVDDIKRAHPEMVERVKQRREEQERLELDVALELINIGYRALATKLHPDRNNGGSHDAMRTLNMIRDSLKRFASKEWGH